MPRIRVTKRFDFEMAHALLAYNGVCKNVHGHTYELEVTLIGDAKNQPGHPEDGMVMDFGQLKNIVNTKIIQFFDHALVINALTPAPQKEALALTTERLTVLGFQPTSENLVTYFAGILQQAFPSNVSLFSLRLYETKTSFAEWFASDNQ
ncbi:MAG: 6-pyruvoyl trahydropterin synthase family protein [Draconibacterium sp.]